MHSSFATYPSLAGRGVLVTGGASGIGAGLVRAFQANGARVAFLDIDDAAARALVAELDGQPHYRHCDLRDIEDLRAALAAAGEAVGGIRVLVNNAGNDARQKFDEVTVADYDRTMAVNLRHVYFAIQAVRPRMRALGGGAIINLSSIAWMHGGIDVVAYAAAKAAIVGLTRALARELGPERIRVNAIAPGAVLTARQLELWYRDPARIDDVLARQCLKERLHEDEIARMALFLAADDSRMITKQCFTVDAGLR